MGTLSHTAVAVLLAPSAGILRGFVTFSLPGFILLISLLVVLGLIIIS
jgi:hypothetical protein